MDDPDHPGALALAPDFEYWGAGYTSIVPPMVALPTDFAGITSSRCVF
ncbi:MAG: hypothetical protein HOY78_23600 [Saccharothrix sp.]|nr:hypothetical protein [Saccharothrix sp.]